MSVETLLVILLVGGIAGWLAGLVMRGRGLGLVGNIIVGILGAFVGGWLLGVLGISLMGGLIGSILQATLGAVVLLAIISVLKKA
ncbi:MAG: GlsB/YeaQ/YmgE family stress response membrane protein [Thermoanaerobaculia bacterium]|nr:GlsB/YeaQ/YmgE family stress response membrane protein [Thermoanaerobaculia bacterium]